ncbi:pentatricopeptide repeat-containing protein At1g53600, mitochondrial-like [Selaginella moellendorffii]|uniref:pentatricopeptide repeat-containing protein At1g53600, mitochondrial-like n=1 Tax=Selaginella moellendorffii TaxID=88036 RepID=UPI000D1C8336|nr:pentatricopeptide repeat-containing protein At1g53600, mitochondrial-like [Selaginella moellendorffii]|eukprot:XP_024539818.1 pentatricopeptide repeat-containing protein At1g53600, mitochondrial-like [Selaginella moellendorffii]
MLLEDGAEANAGLWWPCSTLARIWDGWTGTERFTRSLQEQGDFVQRFCLQQYDGYVCKVGEIAGLLESFRWDDRAGNSVSWNVMIMGYAKGGEAERALELFTAMQALDVVVSSRTLAAFLQACLDMAEKEEARLVDGRLLKVALLEKALAGRLQGLKPDSAGFCIGT